jgi:hypothetical protein
MMNDDTWMIFPSILILVLLSGAWYNFGRHIGGYEGRDKTVVLCVEKPEQCKERYEFLKLREKLGE